MIAKVQPSKQKSRSSFKRLLNYLTTERDQETGKTLLRGDVVMSHNLVGIDTAAAEMKGVESLNPRHRFNLPQHKRDVLPFVTRRSARNEESNDSGTETLSWPSTINTAISKGASARALLRRAERTGNGLSVG